MEQHHRDAIRKNFVVLSKEIDTSPVLAGLIQEKIYEPYQMSTFQGKGGTFQQNQALLANLETRGPRAFDAFCRSLIGAGQEHLAHKLKGSSNPVQPAQFQYNSQPQPDAVPSNQSLISHPSDDLKVWPSPNSPANLEQYNISPVVPMVLEHADDDEVYPMRSKPRGIATIINNKNFRSMKTRSGTDVDAKNLRHLFEELGFNVNVKHDMTADAMTKHMKALSKMNHSAYDCFVLAILSHGIEGAIYGTDERKIRIEDITAYFDGNNSPSLKKKPKLFFLQACRGEMFDRGIEDTDAASAGPVKDEMSEGQGPLRSSDANVKLSEQESEELVQKMFQMELEQPDAFGAAHKKIPNLMDVLLAYATVPGFVSWRNSERGSWFVQALCEVFLQDAQQEDLLSMLTKVNRRVAIAFESSSGRNKQMPAPVTMLTKKLFFFPGYYR